MPNAAAQIVDDSASVWNEAKRACMRMSYRTPGVRQFAGDNLTCANHERIAGTPLLLGVRHLQTNRTKTAGSFYPARVFIHLNLKPQIVPVVVDHLHSLRRVISRFQGSRRPGR